jgi:eukaryotic-like serine/threonine-protein kinase
MDPKPHALAIDEGAVVAEKYVLGRLIGHGTMGEVWSATHRTLGERFAIKLLVPKGDITAARDRLEQRFLFEAQIAARLSQKTRHIVRVTDHGIDRGLPYLVMELLEGATVEAILAREGRMAPEAVVELVSQACRALTVAHAEGVLHRDLKSANLFTTHDEEGRELTKILDFGLARALGATRLTVKGIVMGTAAYMSPEQAVDLASLDAGCDLWALAVVAYEALTGALPFEPEPPEEWLEQARRGAPDSVRQLRLELPSDLDTFFARAFAPHPSDRYADATSMAQAFAAALGAKYVPSEPRLSPASTAEPGDGARANGSAEPMATPGKIISRKYRVESLLGKGGIGVVVLATHLALEQKVAIKFLRVGQDLDASATKRFLREARAAALIQSEHVARVFDYGTSEDGAPYIVMEPLEGTDLSRALWRGPLSVENAVEYVIQACIALAEAHRAGMVHRDLKPANLFLTRRADGVEIIKILDFGISKFARKTARGANPEFVTTGGVMGSPEYMSPEQMKNSKDLDHRADIWALGVVLYELLTASPAFHGETVSQLFDKIRAGEPEPIETYRSSVPKGLVEVIAKCLRKKREDRFGDVGELAGALSPFAPQRSTDHIVRIKSILDSPPPVEGSAKVRVRISTPLESLPSAGRAAPTILTGHIPLMGLFPGGRRSAVIFAALGLVGVLIGLGAARRGHAQGEVQAHGPIDPAPRRDPTTVAAPNASPPPPADLPDGGATPTVAVDGLPRVASPSPVHRSAPPESAPEAHPQQGPGQAPPPTSAQAPGLPDYGDRK